MPIRESCNAGRRQVYTGKDSGSPIWLSLIHIFHPALPEHIVVKMVDFSNEIRKQFIGASDSYTDTIEVTQMCIRDSPITKLSDMKGLKFRVPQSAVMIATYKAFGACLLYTSRCV